MSFRYLLNACNGGNKLTARSTINNSKCSTFTENALQKPIRVEGLFNNHVSFYPKKRMPSRKAQKVIVEQIF